MQTALTIWSNAGLPASAIELLRENVAPHHLVFSTKATASNLVAGGHDPLLEQADVAFGQPDPQQLIDSPNVKWIHLTSAGYTRYDTPAFRAAMKSRSAIVTNSSGVYDAPCAEHVLAMMMAHARQLPAAYENQRSNRLWPSSAIRADSRLLDGQSVLLYGFGAIARRLVELLTPLHMKLTGVRRSPKGDEGIRTITPAQADELLPHTDHIIDILPASPETENFFNADRLGRMNPTAIFYNIGRGSTVDQISLQVALETRRIAAAYLDVTTPEPLPPNNPLWRLHNCIITPHTGGGHATEFERIARHFLANLKKYEANQPLIDRVI